MLRAPACSCQVMSVEDCLSTVWAQAFFTVEALLKIIAIGLIAAPHTYLRSGKHGHSYTLMLRL